MGTIKEKIDQQGRISIIGILDGTNIKPGDLVEVIPEKNKIILKAVKQDKRGGVIESVAGKWKNRPDIVADILNLRREEDREVLKLTRYCVDTNIIVYTMNGLEPAVDFMKEAQERETEIIFSVIVEAELFSSSKLTEEDINDLRKVLDLGEVIEVDSQIALKAGELRRLSKIDHNISLKLPDALIAATAIEQAATLVTRNAEDFEKLLNYGLLLWNPFSP